MSQNDFILLGLPVSVSIDSDLLEENYRHQAKSKHPDNGGSTDDFRKLTDARDTLKNPVSRLKLLLSIHGYNDENRGSLGPQVSEHFQHVAETLQSADTVVRDLEQAKSQLQKALLQARVMKVQKTLGDMQMLLGNVEESLLTDLNDTSPLEAIAQASRDLAFIKKWQKQLQARFASLWV